MTMTGHQTSTPARILDLVELDGDWLTIDQLHADLVLRFGDVRLETVARATHRLLYKGELQSRFVEYNDGYKSGQRLEVTSR